MGEGGRWPERVGAGARWQEMVEIAPELALRRQPRAAAPRAGRRAGAPSRVPRLARVVQHLRARRTAVEDGVVLAQPTPPHDVVAAPQQPSARVVMQAAVRGAKWAIAELDEPLGLRLARRLLPMRAARNQTQSDAIRSDQKRSGAIRSNPKHSEALRSNPKRSAAIKSTQKHSPAPDASGGAPPGAATSHARPR